MSKKTFTFLRDGDANLKSKKFRHRSGFFSTSKHLFEERNRPRNEQRWKENNMSIGLSFMWKQKSRFLHIFWLYEWFKDHFIYMKLVCSLGVVSEVRILLGWQRDVLLLTCVVLNFTSSFIVRFNVLIESDNRLQRDKFPKCLHWETQSTRFYDHKNAATTDLL